MGKCKRYGGHILAAVLCVAMTLLLAGCAADETKEKESRNNEEIRIPMTLIVDSSTGKKNEQELVEAFNREYDGIYEVDADWIMETEEEYRQNLKRMNVTDELPAVITDLRMLPSFYQMMITDGRIEDLSSYILEDGE